MKKLLTPIILALLTLPAFAQFARYESVVLSTEPYMTNNNTGQTTWGGTNSINIAEGEAGELISLGDYGNCYAIKSGVRFTAHPAGYHYSNGNVSPPVGTTVAGPASFLISFTQDVPTGWTPPAGLMTVKITPRFFPPDKTVVVAPGMGNVQVSLESSTNLVHWSTATNGIYGSPDEARFFRVRLQN